MGLQLLHVSGRNGVEALIKNFHVELDPVHFLPLDLNRVSFGRLLANVGRKRERSKRMERKKEGGRQEGEMEDGRAGEE